MGDKMLQQDLKSKAKQMYLWQSDQFIVSKKFRLSRDGEKGLARMRWEERDTSARV